MDTAPPPPPPYGSLIEIARKGARLSIQGAANRARVSKATWIDNVRGYRKRGGTWERVDPKPETIAGMADAVGLPPERLETEGRHPGAAAILQEMRGHEPPVPREPAPAAYPVDISPELQPDADAHLADIQARLDVLRAALRRQLAAQGRQPGEADRLAASYRPTSEEMSFSGWDARHWDDLRARGWSADEMAGGVAVLRAQRAAGRREEERNHASGLAAGAALAGAGVPAVTAR